MIFVDVPKHTTVLNGNYLCDCEHTDPPNGWLEAGPLVAGAVPVWKLQGPRMWP